jgi:hypothetical protein
LAGDHGQGTCAPHRKTGRLKTSSVGDVVAAMAAGLTAAELNPLAGVAVPPAAVADRVGTEAGAPLPCAALRCLELEDGGRNGFMSKRFGG